LGLTGSGINRALPEGSSCSLSVNC